MDALAPRSAKVADTFELLVQIKLLSSPTLAAKDWPIQPPPALQVESSQAEFVFRKRADGTVQPARLLIKVVAPQFRFASADKKSVIVPPTEDSPRVSFLMMPRSQGTHRINIELYNAKKDQIGNLFVTTAIDSDATTAQPQASLHFEIVVAADSESHPIETTQFPKFPRALISVAASMLLLFLVIFYADFPNFRRSESPAMTVSEVGTAASPQASRVSAEATKYQLNFEDLRSSWVVIELTDQAPGDAQLELSDGIRINPKSWRVEANSLPTQNGEPIVVAGVITESQTVLPEEAQKYFRVY